MTNKCQVHFAIHFQVALKKTHKKYEAEIHIKCLLSNIHIKHTTYSTCVKLLAHTSIFMKSLIHNIYLFNSYDFPFWLCFDLIMVFFLLFIYVWVFFFIIISSFFESSSAVSHYGLCIALFWSSCLFWRNR